MAFSRPLLPDATVSLTADDHPALARTLERLLEASKADCVNFLAHNLAGSFEDYKYRCGQIDGLTIAIGLCQQARKKLEA
jgi:hypothetical protein